MSDPTSGATPEEKKSGGRSCLSVFFVVTTLLILFALALGPVTPAVHQPFANVSMQRVHVINLLLFSYANDHDQRYPDGKSSTEVFQKLIDEKYCSDPILFYLPLPGKVSPTDGQKLKPENVCFDVTSGLDSSSPELLPAVFLTGYKVLYVPGGAALSIAPPGSSSLSYSLVERMGAK